MYRQKIRASIAYFLVAILCISLPGSTAFAFDDEFDVSSVYNLLSFEATPSIPTTATVPLSPVHLIEFDLMGGEFADLESVETSFTVIDGESLGDLPIPIKDGYDFLGWFSDEDGGIELSYATIPTESIILYARWVASAQFPAIIEHTLSFSSHGGSAVPSQSIVDGEELGTLPVPTRANHRFIGWFTQASGGMQASNTTLIAGDTTLHARWAFVPIRVSSVRLPALGTIDNGRTRNLQATFQPTNFTRNQTTISWHSSNTRVATVNNNGQLRAVGRGTATITVSARTADGATVSARQNVTVRQRVNGISTVPSLRMVRGRTATLPAIPQPFNANERRVRFSSNNPRVVSINAHGEMRARSTGVARITIRSVDGGHRAQVNVRVVPRAVGLRNFTLQHPNTERTVNVGARTRLRANPVPANATHFMPRFTSSNPSVARVDRSGMITGVSHGSARITVEQGTIRRSVMVRVGSVRAQSISLNLRSATVVAGNNVQLRANVSPASTNPSGIRWSSSNTRIATVNNQGQVRGLREGRAVISARTWNNRLAQFTVNVRPAPFSYVQNANLRFTSPPQRRRSTEGIVLHHTVGNINVQQTHRIHIDRGMWGIAYHFLIDRQGRVWQGRPLDTGGGHVRGALNERTIGIAWVGNFENEHITPAARTSGERLINDILRAYPSIRWIHGHGSLRTHIDSTQTATACPGRNFPTAHFRRLLR